MSALIYNKDKKFWNGSQRCWTDTPYEYSSNSHAYNEHKMAAKSDNTADIVYADSVEAGIEFLNKLELTDDYISDIKEMNRCILERENKND